MNATQIYLSFSMSQWAVKVSLFFMIGVASAQAGAAVSLTGGPPSNPTDITSHLLANDDIEFTGGGHFIALLPAAGADSRVVEAQTADPALTTNGSTRTGNVGFSSKQNPTIVYTGLISGNGVLTVRSAFNTTPPTPSELFTGGVLMFNSLYMEQTWGVEGIPSGGHNAPALIIDPNATVSFFFPGRGDFRDPIYNHPTANVFATSPTKSRNILNNGSLYSSTQNQWGSITGTGISVFSWWGGDAGNLAAGSVYSANRFIAANGLRQSRGVAFENQSNGKPTTIVAADIMVFQNGALQWLTSPGTFKVGDAISSISSNISFWALNVQLWTRGIFQFTGIALPHAGGRNYNDISPDGEALKAMNYYGTNDTTGFGRTINLNNRVTLLMGDGREVVKNADGITDNTFYQGNPFNTLISATNFESGPLGAQNQAMAYNYSGTYRLNTNFNVSTNPSKGYIASLRNGDWVNLLFLDPTEWNRNATRPNHAIVTVPVMFAGLTRIDRNAILQLGDGTVGNDLAAASIIINGKTIISRYSDSMGNGMLMTKGNEALVPKGAGREQMNAAVQFEIRNNGQIIVNNTIGALSATRSDGTRAGVAPEIADWMNANQLDGITGVGGVEQRGTQVLTLGSVSGNANSYTGGTMIRSGSTLQVASADALGSRDRTGKGNVLNIGTLRAVGGIRTIQVPGDYRQVGMAATAQAISF